MKFDRFFRHHLKDNNSYHFQINDKGDGYYFQANKIKNNEVINIDTWYSWRNDTDINILLNELSQELSIKLTDRSFIEKHLFLLKDGEYEHNTNDNFFNFFPNIDSVNTLNKCILNTGNLVGYITKKFNKISYSINISSRFGDLFLMCLISDTDGFLEMEKYGSYAQNGLTDWILTYLWKSKLKKAHRLGLPKEYVSKEEHLPRIRGKINLDHFMNNENLIPPYLCRYREHSYDNLVTQLINLAFKSIENQALIVDCSRLKHDFLIATSDKRRSIKMLLKCNGVKNPFYLAYNDVIQLSKMLVRKEHGDIGESNADTNAFFFDISMLFEHFIRKLFIRNGHLVEEKNLLKHKISRGNKGLRSIKPDIVIYGENDSVEIYDVKYKNFNFKEGVNTEDLYQLHTYVGFFSNKYFVKKCGFIYPIREKDFVEKNEKFLKNIINISGVDIDFNIHFFSVPDENEKDSKVYYKLFQESMINFIQAFNS